LSVRRIHPDAAAIGVLIALWLLFFWRLVTPVAADRTMLVEGDFSDQFVAFGAYQYQRLTAGEIPLWNPYNNGGLPFVADTQAAAFYPPRLVTIALAHLIGGWTYSALQIEMMTHVLAYTLLNYAFARRLTLHQPGSVLAGLAAAIVAGYGGFMAGYPPLQLALLEAAVWLPLGLIGVVEATRANRLDWRWLTLAGFGLGLSWMAGHPQTSWFITYLLVAYLAYRAYERCWPWTCWMMGTALMGAVSFGMAAVQLIPGVEYLLQTTRAGLDFDAKGNGFSYGELAQMLFPGLLSLWSPLYVGVIGLLLAVTGAWTRTRETLFWTVVIAVGLALSFGANSVFFHALYNTLPGLSFFRGQERAAYLVSVGTAVLAGLGMIALLADTQAGQRAHRSALILLALCGVMTIATFQNRLRDPELYGTAFNVVMFSTLMAGCGWGLLAAHRSTPGRITAWALTGLLVFDLFSVNIDNSNFQPAQTAPLRASSLVEVVQADDDVPFRVDGSYTGIAGNLASLYNVMDIRGISPLFLESAHAIIERELPSETDWELFAVRYVISPAESLPSPTDVIAEETRDGSIYRLHRLTDPRPFAHLVYDVEVIDSDAFARALLADPRFDARTTAILNTAPAIALPDEPPPDASATVTQFAPESFSIEISTTENALLTLSHLDYIGWRATLDGEPVTILRAYGALSAIAVPAGDHVVEFVYRPLSVQVGAALSLFTGLALSILGLRSILRSFTRRTVS
jgi:hypothetical protein